MRTHRFLIFTVGEKQALPQSSTTVANRQKLSRPSFSEKQAIQSNHLTFIVSIVTMVRPDFSIINQYAKNLDPSTAEGGKLLSKMTRSSNTDEDRLEASFENAKEVLDHFQDEAFKFAWGTLVLGVPIQYRLTPMGQLSYATILPRGISATIDLILLETCDQYPTKL